MPSSDSINPFSLAVNESTNNSAEGMGYYNLLLHDFILEVLSFTIVILRPSLHTLP
tara:strand:- start:155 stop:322 length:168 start_codon:yes stop_codon:yes gene_type:complete